MLLFTASLAALVVAQFRPPVDIPQDQAMVATTPVSFQPLEDPILSVKPIATVVPPEEIEAFVAVEEPKTPVQPIEERGDSMLFEADALFGMPFDQAIAMPFD